VQALSRRPTSDEVKNAIEDIAKLTTQWESYLKNQNDEAPRTSAAKWSALASFCHELLNSAEFAYID